MTQQKQGTNNFDSIDETIDKVKLLTVTGPIDLDDIDSRVTQNESDISDNASAISDNASDISDNQIAITNIELKTDFITVTQAVNLDTMESNISTNADDITAIETKTDFITVTQAVNLDTMESQIATNVTNIGNNATGVSDNASDIVDIKLKTDFITVTQLVDLDIMESQITTNVTNIGNNTSAISDNASDIVDIELKTDFITVTGVINLDDLLVDVTANNAKITYDDAALVAQHTSDITNIELKTDHITVTQAVNLDTMESDISTNNSKISYIDAALVAQHTTDITNIELKTDFITVTQSVNLDTMESDISTNNAKRSYPVSDENKLATIEDNAEVNNISDANATDLTDTGESALHYHDTDRARANHTGTQLAVTISDFQTTVSSNTDVAASKIITDHITVTQAVDLDTIESDTNTNNGKVSFPEAPIDSEKYTRRNSAWVTLTSSDIPIVDVNDYYLATDVEAALDEIGENKRWNGFDLEDPDSNGEISFVTGTRTFTIDVKGGESEFAFWCVGKKFIKTTPQSVVIPDVTGLYYTYFDTSGVLQSIIATSITGVLFETVAFVGQLYWNATNTVDLIGNERHGTRMDPATHAAMHLGIGALYHEGLDITGLANGSPTYTNTTSGQYADEDINHNISLQATHPWLYRLGTDGEWTTITADNNVAHIEGGDTYASWNEYTGATWQLTEGGVLTDYFITFFVAAPDPAVYKIMGQNAYPNVTAARNAIEDELATMQLAGLPSTEMSFLYAVIVNRNGDLEELADGSTFYDLRVVRGGTGSTGGTSNVAGDVTTNVSNFNSNLSAADTDVQKALDTLDDLVVAVALDGITDVTITTPANNEVLAYNGAGLWINQTAAEAGLSVTGHTHTASEVTDFDTEVSNNSNVTTNSAKVSYDDAALVAQHTTDITDIETKTDWITVTQAVNLDTMETNIATNNGKISYTDASKVAGIEDNAEVNNISDVNATDLTNAGESTLHYHDADRARANHSGTQTASTISDFDTEVSTNSAVAANTDKVTFDSTASTKVDHISVTQAVNLDTMESDISDNNSKVSFPEAPIDTKQYARKDAGWEEVAASASTLEDLTDTIITTPATGELIKYSGGNWINNTLAEAGVAAASHTHTASQVTDFDTEVSNNSSVSTNSGKVSYTDAAVVSGHTTDIGNIETKTDFITVTQNVNLDTMESNIATNNGKVTYDDAALVATHTTDISNLEDDVAELQAYGTVGNETASFTLALTDAQTYRTCNSSSTITITVPPNSSVAFPIGTAIAFERVGTGAVTMAQGSGVTIRSASSNKSISDQYTTVALKKVATDIWTLVGSLST